MPSYKLTYFSERGRAELTRLIFVTCGIHSKMKHFPLPNGLESKNQVFLLDQIITPKKIGFFTETPLGQVPYLTLDNEKIPQSIAYSRMLARRFNIAGGDELEQMRTDVVVDTVTDLQNVQYLRKFGKSTESRNAVMTKFIEEEVPTHLERIEKIVSIYGNEGFSVGNSLKWSDLHIFDVTSSMLELNSNILSKFPKIQAIRKTVESNEKVAAYLRVRAKTEF